MVVESPWIFFNFCWGECLEWLILCMLCCCSGHLVCSLLSIMSPFTCVLCSRAFLRYLSWLPLWNPVGSSCSTLPRWVQIMQIMHVATYVLAVCSVMSRLPLYSHTILRLCLSWSLFVEYDWISSTLTRWVLGLNSRCSVLPFAVASGNHCHFTKLTSGQSTFVVSAHLCIVDQPWWNVKTSVSLQSLVELLCRSCVTDSLEVG